MNTHERIEFHLDTILEKHIECNSKLLDLIKEERQYIVHNTLEKLDAINQEKMMLREAINALERERMVLMPHLRDRYNIAREDVRLDDVVEAVNEPYKTRYRHKRVCLKKILDDIKIAHEGNKLLIQQSLSFHERAFNLLYNLKSQQVGYGEDGGTRHKEGRLCDRIG